MAVTVQMQFESVVTELYQDAFVGSSIENGTTIAATKIAVRALMEGYGWELRRYGISTTTINPGFVVSEMTARNQFPMPFLLPTDVAARKIARAIQRQRRSDTFPRPMAIAAHLLPFIPSAILGRVTPPDKLPSPSSARLTVKSAVRDRALLLIGANGVQVPELRKF